MRNFLKILISGIVLICWSTAASSAIRLPAIISDNMVMQNGIPVPVWGWADYGEEITVIINDKQYSGRAGADGRWKIMLEKLKSGQVLEMVIRGSSGSSVTVKNILVGEVWICSGQSNMHWTFAPMHGVLNNESELAAANYSEIRMFTVEKKGAAEPAEDVKGEWLTISPENLLAGAQNGASAVAYFFGRDLYRQLHVPIGLINSSLGGASAEQWTSREALEAVAELKSLGDKIQLYFDHQGSGLTSSDGKPLTEFAIAGSDQEFMPARAEIIGKKVFVSHEDIDNPVAVRYAWRDDVQPNLSNKEGLPASPFRTDTWKGVTEK